jgi:hypothetical protein
MRHPPRLALPPPLARHLPHSFTCPRTAGGDRARSADHQVHRLQPADLPAVRRQGQDLRRVPPAHRRRRSDLAAPAPRSLRFLFGSGWLTWSCLIVCHAVTFSSNVGGGGGGAGQSGWFRMFSVAAYKPYFDVDTSDVVERIWESVFPFGSTFTEKTSENPDLYARTCLRTPLT